MVMEITVDHRKSSSFGRSPSPFSTNDHPLFNGFVPPNSNRMQLAVGSNAGGQTFDFVVIEFVTGLTGIWNDPVERDGLDFMFAVIYFAGHS